MRQLTCRTALLCLLLVPAATAAQGVRGTVVEDSTRAPIEGALVELVLRGGESIGRSESDSTGAFDLPAARPGVFVIRLSHPSYAAVESDSFPLGPGEDLVIELRMGRRAIPLQPLVVTARGTARSGGFYQRLQRPGFGRFVTRADIDARPPSVRITDLLRTQPGVEIVPVLARGGNFVNVVMMRGGAGRCAPAIVIDGAFVRQYPESGLDDFLKPDMLEGVEIYTSSIGAPPQLSPPGNSCGVIAFWTRTGSDAGGKLTWKRVLAGAAAVAGLLLLIALTR